MPDEQRDAPEELPKPHDGMTPEEKGELLLRYVAAKKPLHYWSYGSRDKKLHRLDFSKANLSGHDLSTSDLTWSNLVDANLAGALLAGARLDMALMSRANLTGANCWTATFFEATLDEANLDGVDFHMAQIEGASLARCTGHPETVEGLQFDLETYKRSEWTPTDVEELCRHGARPVGLNAFPAEVQEAVFVRDGLTFFLSTRLLPWDQTMLHAFACSVLGTDTDVRVAEYTETVEGCRVRLTGANPDDLIKLAEYISQVAWRSEQKHALQTTGLLGVEGFQASMDHIRKNTDRMEVWVREQQEQDAVKETLPTLKRAWSAEVLKAGLDHLLSATGIKGLIEAGGRAAGQIIDAVSDAKDERDRKRWEADIARQELDEGGEVAGLLGVEGEPEDG